MTVGILLITHSGIGDALMATLINTFGHLPMPMKALSVGNDPSPEQLAELGCSYAKELNNGKGVLVLTDMIGSTPCNVAQKIKATDIQVKVISGVNLPILFRILNYPELELDVIARNAINAGREGIIDLSCEPSLVVLSSSKKRVKRKPACANELKSYDPKANSNH